MATLSRTPRKRGFPRSFVRFWRPAHFGRIRRVGDSRGLRNARKVGGNCHRYCHRRRCQTLRPGGDALSAVRGVVAGGELRERFDGPLHVQQSWVRVNIHGEVDARMPHRGLCDAGSDSRHAQHRAERMPQSVNVDRASPVVTLWDSRHLQVTVENLAERLWDVEPSPTPPAMMTACNKSDPPAKRPATCARKRRVRSCNASNGRRSLSLGDFASRRTLSAKKGHDNDREDRPQRTGEAARSNYSGSLPNRLIQPSIKSDGLAVTPETSNKKPRSSSGVY